MNTYTVRPVIGLASTADPHGYLQLCRSELTRLADRLGFDLKVSDRILTTREDAEAAACAFSDQRADFVLLVCNSFTANGEMVLPLAATSARLGLWALPEPLREGPLQLTSLVDLNLFASVLAHFSDRAEPQCKWFYGLPSDARFLSRFEVTVRALRVLKGLRQATVGYIGGHAPGFINLQTDERALARNLATRVETLPLEEVISAARACDEGEAAREGQRLASMATAVTCSTQALTATGRLICALRQVAEMHHFSALAVSCWPGFYQALNVFPCTAYGTLNAEGLVVSCEGDVMGAVSLLALRLAGNTAPTLMDMVSILPDEDATCFWHCGLATWQFADQEGVRLITRQAPGADGMPQDVPGFADVTFAPGQATIARVGRDGKQLLVAEGTITDRLGRSYEGSGGWVTGLRLANRPIAPLQFLDAIVRQGVEHHYAVLPEAVADVLLEAAAWSGMKLVEAQEVGTSI